MTPQQQQQHSKKTFVLKQQTTKTNNEKLKGKWSSEERNVFLEVQNKKKNVCNETLNYGYALFGIDFDSDVERRKKKTRQLREIQGI